MKRLLILAFAAVAAFGQQNAMMLPWTPQQFTNTNGTILASGKVCSYLAGTSTGTATFTDATAAVQNAIPPNAILLDSTGRPTSGGIWLTPNKAYKIVTMTAGSDNTCSTGVVVKTQDNVIANNAFGTNIQIVDGVRFAQSAAGINAADAALGASFGEIWIPNGPQITATDAQISISANHILKNFSSIRIEANNTKGPILLGNNAGVICSGDSTGNNFVENTGSATISSMIRLSVQDGSQNNNFIAGCDFFANSSTVTNGVIDFSGFTGRGWIRDNVIQSFNSGWGIFVQDIQSGALNGTSNIQIMNNRIVAAGTGACIELLHSATNAVTIANIDILDTNCTVGTTSTTSLLIQNSDATPSHLRQINISNLQLLGIPTGQSGLVLSGVQQSTAKGVTCTGTATNCVSISNTANNGALTFDNIFTYAGNNSLNDAVNSITLGGPALLHYEFPNANTTFSYLPAVSYLRVNGLAPTSATGTGFGGAGLTFSVNPGSTNNGGIIVVTPGAAPSASGTLTINFNTTQTNFGVNSPGCVITLGNLTGSWNARASAILASTAPTSVVVNWDNNAVNLTAASTYDFHYWCAAK